jgi:MoaA/NifB/PqqE/SkfB family radical SAM enzyme
MNAPGLYARLPFYYLYRRFGWPKMLPLSIVISVSYRCNSRCATCDVWRKPNDDLTVDEWQRVFHSIGHAPYYITFTGGEPFMRRDLADLVRVAWEECRPSILTIPTNGLLPKIVPDRVREILDAAPTAQLGINLSLDNLGPKHDKIRGVPGNWEKAMQTWEGLKAINHPNLRLSVHTVVSKFNVTEIPAIYDGLQQLAPDSYITEVAEERVELDTVGWEITPSADEYAPVADFLVAKTKQKRLKGLAEITQAFRGQYYQLTERILREQRQVIPCHAGWASCQIAPNGDIWSCCVRAEPVGNLRQVGYDFKTIWFSSEADKLRGSIYRGECACPMANASYTNMLLHPPTLAKVVGSLLR